MFICLSHRIWKIQNNKSKMHDNYQTGSKADSAPTTLTLLFLATLILLEGDRYMLLIPKHQQEKRDVKSLQLSEGYPAGQGLCQQKSALRTEPHEKGSLWAGSANRWTLRL